MFLNGAGTLSTDIEVGDLILPKALIREEGTSFHYLPADVALSTSELLNSYLVLSAQNAKRPVHQGTHWTTDAIFRETFGKIQKFRRQGVLSVEMELSALAAVARYRRCELSSLLVVTDILSEAHTWAGINEGKFQEGVQSAAEIAVSAMLDLINHS